MRFSDWSSDVCSSDLLYFHGGAYLVGAPTAYRGLTARLAQWAQARVAAVDYRLAPEHPFPAATDDALDAYRGLLERGIVASDIVLAGDSAGGGLTLARSEEHTSELQSLMRISYAFFCLK